MEKLAGYCLYAVLLVAGFISVSGQEEVKYVKNGGTLTVKPSSVSGKITSITWKHNGNFVAEWMDGKVDLTYYGQFKGRTTMDTTTGSLEIRNMGPVDSGEFVVEINNNVQSKTDKVKVIQPVPKPDVSIQPPECDDKSESCTLVCGGNIEGAEPVTYSWNLGDEWKNRGKEQIINKATYSVKEFSCRMMNPISEETSKPKRNPFYNDPKLIIGGVLGGLVAAVVAVGGGVLGWIYHKKQRAHSVSSSNGRPLADDANADKPSEGAELMNSGAAEKPATESG